MREQRVGNDGYPNGGGICLLFLFSALPQFSSTSAFSRAEREAQKGLEQSANCMAGWAIGSLTMACPLSKATCNALTV